MNKVRMGEIVSEAQAIIARAEAQRRDISPAENAQVNRLLAEYDKLEAGGVQDDVLYFRKLRLKLVQ